MNEIDKDLETRTPAWIVAEARSHLAVAVAQMVPSDDQIIAGHVRAALVLLDVLRAPQAASRARSLAAATDAIATYDGDPAAAPFAAVLDDLTREAQDDGEY